MLETWKAQIIWGVMRAHILEWHVTKSLKETAEQ